MTDVVFSDGMTLRVETREGLVQLVTRNQDGVIVGGQEISPTEAHHLGEALIKAAFTARSSKNPH